MRFHRNAKLGLAGRRELVLAIAGGCSIRAAATTFNVSAATAHRWWQRWRQASEAERTSLSCLLDRSSRPTRSPRRLAPEAERAICECRRKTGWGPRLVAGATGFCHSTVWKVLRRFGLSRPERLPRAPANRYEWPCPGDLLHVDVSRYARFLRPKATLGHILGDGRLSYQLTEPVRSQLATRLSERVCVPRGSRSVAATRQESMVRRPPARTTASFPPELESPRAVARSTPPHRTSTRSVRWTTSTFRRECVL
jgi:transposase